MTDQLGQWQGTVEAFRLGARNLATGRPPDADVAEVGDETTLHDLVNAHEVVLVVFSAPWCFPCRQLEPELHRLAAEHPELRVARVDVEAAPELAQRFDVQTLSTLILFRAGQEVARLVGARRRERVLADLDLAVCG